MNIIKASTLYDGPGVKFQVLQSGSVTQVIASNGSIIVVGDSQAGIYYSEDNGETWRLGQAFPNTATGIQAIIWTGTQFVAGSSTGVWTSDNGKEWYRITTTNVGYLAYNGSIYVGYAGAIIKSSTDLINWTNRYTSGRGNAGAKVVWTGSSFLVGDNGSGLIFRSTDGISWKVTEEGLDKNCIVTSSTPSTYRMYGSYGYGRTSTDGNKWTAINYSSGGTPQKAIWEVDNNRYIAVGGQYAQTSTDGITFTNRSAALSLPSGYPVTLFDVAKKPGGNYVAVGSYDTKVYSTDGITWSAINTTRIFPFLQAYTPRAIVSNGSSFIIESSYTRFYRTTDGTYWDEITHPLSVSSYAWKIGFGNGKYIAISNGNNKVMNSTDGITWNNPTNMPSSSTWSTPIWTGDKYVSHVNSSLTYATSTDGITWTSANRGAGSTGTIASNACAAVLGNYVVFSTTGTFVLQSSDSGSTWTAPTVNYAGYVASGNGKFLLVSSAASTTNYATSTDGITWSYFTNLPFNATWTDVAWSGSEFYVISSTYIVKSTDAVTWKTVYQQGGGFTMAPVYGAFDSSGKSCMISNNTTSQAWIGTNDIFETTGSQPDLRAVVWNPNANKFYAYGGPAVSTSRGGSIIQESTDGVTWTYSGAQTIPSLLQNRKFTYSSHAANTNTTIAICGMGFSHNNSETSYTYAISKDGGNTWGMANFPAGVGAPKTSIANNGTRFVVFHASAAQNPTTYANFYYSDDGFNWTLGTVTANVYTSVIWTGTEFVAVGFGSSRAAITSGIRSTDGISWTSFTMPSRNWADIAYGNSVYVANYTNGQSTNHSVYRSTDLITWTQINLPTYDPSFSGGFNYTLKFLGGKFFALENGTVCPSAIDYIRHRNGKYYYSTDGNTWSIGSFPKAAAYSDISYNGSVYCVLVGGGFHSDITDVAYVSTDGISWSSVTLPIQSRWINVETIGTSFVAITEYDSHIAKSTDGVTWNLVTPAIPTTIYAAKYSTDGKTWVVGSDGNILYTTDNVKWNKVYNDSSTAFRNLELAHDGGVWAVGSSGQIVKIDNNNVWWQPHPPNTALGRYGYASNPPTYIGKIGDVSIYCNVSTVASGTDWLIIRKGGLWRTLDVPGCALGTYFPFIMMPYNTTTVTSSPQFYNGYKQNLVYNPNDGKYYTRGVTFGLYTTLRTTDGYSWEVVSASTGASATRMIGYIGGKYISAYDGTNNTYQIYTSTDAINWSISSITSAFAGMSATSPSALVILNYDWRAFTTTDGVTWTTVNSTTLTNSRATEIYWHSPSSKFYAFGEFGYSYSTDGITWTWVDAAYPDGKSSVVSMVDNVFVYFTSWDRLGRTYKYSSTDGTTWTSNLCEDVVASTDVGSSTNWQSSILHDGQSYIAWTGYGSTNCYVSTDGIKWTTGKHTGRTIRDIKRTGNCYTYIDTTESAGGSPGQVYTSDYSGDYWYMASMPSENWHSIRSDGAGNVMTTGYYAHGYSNDDGLTWSYQMLNRHIGSNYWLSGVPSPQAINYFDGKYTINMTTGTVDNWFESPDRYYWYRKFYKRRPITSATLSTAKLGNIVAICGYSHSSRPTGNMLMTTTDGIVWSSPPELSQFRRRTSTALVCANPDLNEILAVGLEQKTYSTTDGINWKYKGQIVHTGANPGGTLNGMRYFSDIAYGNGKYVLISGAMKITGSQTSESVYCYSTDGITWTQSNLPTVAPWYCIAYGNGMFVVVSKTSATPARSTNGITWTGVTTPLSSITGITSMYCVFQNGLFVLYDSFSQAQSRIATSTDGITWSYATTADYDFGGGHAGMAYGNGMWLATGNRKSNLYSDILRSTDGVTWTVNEFPFASNPSGVIYINGKFIVSVSDYFYESTDGIIWTTEYNKSFHFSEKINGNVYRGGTNNLITKNEVNKLSITNLTTNLNGIAYA